MNVIGKECPHDCEATSARPTVKSSRRSLCCVNCATRREGISEVMRVHPRVLQTLRPVLITSPEDQTACPEPWAT